MRLTWMMATVSSDAPSARRISARQRLRVGRAAWASPDKKRSCRALSGNSSGSGPARVLAIADHDVGRHAAGPTLQPMAAVGRVVRPEGQGRTGLARGTSKHRHGPSHVAHHDIELPFCEQRAQIGASRPNGPRFACADFAELMHVSAGFHKFVAQAALRNSARTPAAWPGKDRGSERARPERFPRRHRDCRC